MNTMQERSQIPGAGIDLHDRPGVPMETEPRPVGHAHWQEPERQKPQVRVLKRAGLERLTPVISNAIPPRGLSGIIRRAAYRIPEHRMSHWLLLLAGDRIDVLEHRLTRSIPLSVSVAAVALGLAMAPAMLRGRRRRQGLLRRLGVR